jgi:hypothetical protein
MATLAAIRRLRAFLSYTWKRPAPKLNESGSTDLPTALKNVAAGPELGHLTVLPPLLQQPAEPQTPLGAKNTCPAGKIQQS